MGRHTIESDSLVSEKRRQPTVSRVPPDTGNPVGTWGDHPPSLNTCLLYTSLKTLTAREEKVLSLRFGLEDGHPRTLEEVGKEFNVTRERIRQRCV